MTDWLTDRTYRGTGIILGRFAIVVRWYDREIK
jgi:hypothetical protein